MTDIIPAQAWLPAFRRIFLPRIQVASKEAAKPGPITPYRAQINSLSEIANGLEAGVHDFTFLKARQLGLSTIFLALDIFWLYMFPGLQGAFICDSEGNRENFRQMVTTMMTNLPKGFQIPISKHDRNMLVLQNGSMLQYMSAGKKAQNSDLARSRALNFVHATELCKWGDPKAVDTLRDALALTNPNRLYIFESTALGFNLFYDVWKDAQDDPINKRAIFVGWWCKDIYQYEEDTPNFHHWWGINPTYSEYEAKMTLQVHQLYGWEIKPSQWAWYRHIASSRSEQSMMEEYPTTEIEAFQETGSPYFNGKTITTDMKVVDSGAIEPQCYTYVFSDHFLQMRLRRSEFEDEVYLRVWETPQPDAKYVIGVDPAYGSSEEADRTVISVWRCFADKLVQVAEYVNPLTTTQNCAWALAHLAGEYRDNMINLELQGGGGEVMHEIAYLKKAISFGGLQVEARAMRVEHMLDSARWFLYRKADSIASSPAVYNTKMNAEMKPLVLNRFNDAYSSQQIIVRSRGLLDEMRTIKRDGDKIRAGGRSKDDRVIAAALANYAWKEYIQPGMMSENRTWDREMRSQHDRQATSYSVLSNIVPSFFAEQQERRNAIENQALVDRPFDA